MTPRMRQYGLPTTLNMVFTLASSGTNLQRVVGVLVLLFSRYSTGGYGDVVLPRTCRLLGPVESVTGVLMCGISATCLFAVATRLIERESGAPPMQYVNGLDGFKKLSWRTSRKNVASEPRQSFAHQLRDRVGVNDIG